MSSRPRSARRGKKKDAETPETPETPSTGAVPTLGQRVDVARGRGSVRFVGEVKFAEGVWVGVDLDEPNGKHNGEVDGERYFFCQDKHGVFVRPENTTILPAPTSPSANPMLNPFLV